MTQASDTLRDHLLIYYLNPRSGKWKGGPGQVVLNASEQDREQFRQLKSDHIANFVDNELAAFMAMSEEDQRRHRFREENERLIRLFDESINAK